MNRDTGQPGADVAELGRLLRAVAFADGEMGSPASTDELKRVVREVFAENAVDTLPYSYNVETAMKATGLSKTRIHDLIRKEAIAVRKEGSKLFIVGTSLRRYIDSLPPRGLR